MPCSPVTPESWHSAVYVELRLKQNLVSPVDISPAIDSFTYTQLSLQKSGTVSLYWVSRKYIPDLGIDPGTFFCSQQPMLLTWPSAKAEALPRSRIAAESSIFPFS